jgi:pimeloyl-ACP methyl ester carboxylesterase
VSAEPRYRALTLETARGPVEARHYVVPGSSAAAVLVGGVGGGWDTPAAGRLYPSLAHELAEERATAALRVRYRNPTDLEEATSDVVGALAFLEAEGVDRVALVGHSFGGAVVLRAAATRRSVATVVALSTQSYGAEAASELRRGCSLLLVHGRDDEVLPPRSSEWVYSIAREPKRLVLLPGTRHGLDEAADAVYALVRDWILAELADAP